MAVIALSIVLFMLAIAEAAGTPGLVAVSADLGCFLVGTALAGTIAFGYWRDVMLDEEDLEVAARMRDIYRRAQSLIKEQPARTDDYLTATGKEALDEHADWFARHRDRLRLPEAG